MKVKDCKLRKVISCDKQANIVEIAKKLRDSKERHIIILDNKKPIGIISTTDINNRIVAENKNPEKTIAEEIMTAPILIKDIKDSLEGVYVEMLEENVFSCPIIENEKLIGTLDLKEATRNLLKNSKKE